MTSFGIPSGPGDFLFFSSLMDFCSSIYVNGISIPELQVSEIALSISLLKFRGRGGSVVKKCSAISFTLSALSNTKF